MRREAIDCDLDSDRWRSATTAEARIRTARASARVRRPLVATVAPPVTRHEARKIVTVRLLRRRRLDGAGRAARPRVVRGVMSRFFDEMRGVLERHGGTVEKFIGDAVMAVFGVPHRPRGRRAARRARRRRDARGAGRPERRARAALGRAARVRTGVNTGEVVAGEPTARRRVRDRRRRERGRPARADGGAPARSWWATPTSRSCAARSELEAPGRSTLKGKAEPVRAWRLVGGTVARRHATARARSVARSSAARRAERARALRPGASRDRAAGS